MIEGVTTESWLYANKWKGKITIICNEKNTDSVLQTVVVIPSCKDETTSQDPSCLQIWGVNLKLRIYTRLWIKMIEAKYQVSLIRSSINNTSWCKNLVTHPFFFQILTNKYSTHTVNCQLHINSTVLTKVFFKNHSSYLS
jgi:hypothetical protein